MALRWKKNPRPTGLARVCCGPLGSTLRIDGKVRAATVNAHARRTGWYWVAGWEATGVPHYNSCCDAPLTEVEAKAAALSYVRKHLSA